MATEFKLPDLGENIASGDVVTVFVSAGDVIQPGQALLEVETDKAVIEVPCPPGGRVASVLVKKGDTVKVGQALFMLESDEQMWSTKPGVRSDFTLSFVEVFA